MASFGHQLSVVGLWQTYFRNPSEWWENRNSKLHNRSPDFWHKRTEETLWVENWKTQHWTREVLKWKIGGGSRLESDTISDAGERTDVELRPLQRDEFAWTSLIIECYKCRQNKAALRVYAEMQQDGVKPSSYTLVAALKACRGLRDVKTAKQIHAEVVRHGFESDVYVGNMLIHVYAKCGSLADARRVFDRMPRRDVVSWNSMILGYAQMEAGEEALGLYASMTEQGLVQDARTFVAALKACNSLADLEVGTERGRLHMKHQHLNQVRVLHGDILKSGSDSDVFVGNMLVDAYAKCGSLVDARRVFEEMPQRNVVSWTAMIWGYAQTEECAEALQLYAQMQQEGTLPNDRTFVGALKACSSLAALEEVKKVAGKPFEMKCLVHLKAIHLDIVKSGSELAVFVATMLVDAYVKCGSLFDARLIFDKMPQRDVVSWNAMIFGYVKMEQGEEALGLYTRMQREGVLPDTRAFVGALKACSCLVSLEEGPESTRKYVENWYLGHVKTIHSDIVKSGCISDIFVGNMLVDAYVKCGSLVDARSIFDSMSCRNVISWSAIILGYAQIEQGEEALNLYTRMQREGLVPNDRTFVAALKACSSLANLVDGHDAEGMHSRKQCLEQVNAIHLDIVRRGYKSDVFVETMLVDVYAKCGDLLAARHVFDRMSHRDVASWNAMILGYAQMEQGDEALQVYGQMQKQQVVPDSRTFVGVLKACTSLFTGEGGIIDGVTVKHRCLEQVRAVHSDIVQSGFEFDVFVGNMLVDVYAKLGNLVDARSVFEKLPHRNVVAWTAMILGYAQMEVGEAALQLYARMQLEGVEPNDRTLVGALKACGIVAGLERGKEIHSHFRAVDLFVASTLIEMYSKCGSMDDAQQVFDSLPTRDVVTWNALISGYALRGDSDLVFYLFHRMVQEDQQPDSCTFLSILTACNHGGLVDKGEKYFEAMIGNKSVSPTIEHYNCLVDLLARAGHMEKAMEIVKAMPFEAPGKVWRCLLSACQKWGKVELGRHVFECAVGVDQNDAAAYVLMLNIYAGAGMPEAVKEIQALRVQACAWKKPGQSWWTEAGGTVHAFMVGAGEHPESRRIYAKLQNISAQIKVEGYMAGLSDFYTPGNRDQDLLCVQNKKLAAANAMVHASLPVPTLGVTPPLQGIGCVD